MNLELTEAEHLALRYVLDNWVLTSAAKANAPFCYVNCKSSSEKLGEAPNDLRADPVCAAWYEKFDECGVCCEITTKDKLVAFEDAKLRCPECLKDAQTR